VGPAPVSTAFPGEYEARPWYRKRTNPRWGTPDDELGVALPVRLLVAATSKASVVLYDLIAYSAGFEFLLGLRYSGRDPRVDPMSGERYYYAGEDTDRCFRFGVEYADGTRITSVDRVAGVLDKRPEDFPRLVRLLAGGGGDTQSRNLLYRWWVDGLPSPGRVVIAVEWPAADISFKRLDLIDGSVLASAGAQQSKLWPADPIPPPS